MIRFATEEDAQALLAIYAYYIDTEITFEYELPTEAEFRKRIRTVLEEYPYLIYEDAGNILGYAYAHRHLERAAYQWNVELTVYLHPDVVSRGIGRRLYEELLRILTEQGICNAYSLITRPNEKSEKLHEAMGFTLMGVLKNTGYKNGKWQLTASVRDSWQLWFWIRSQGSDIIVQKPKILRKEIIESLKETLKGYE